jgi:transposase
VQDGGEGKSKLPKKRKKTADEREERENKDIDKKLLRAMKIRLRLTASQRKEVIKAIAMQRAAYNFANDLVRNYGAHAKMDKLRDAWFGWKDEIRNNRFGDSHEHRFLTNSGVHNKIEAQGIRQLEHAYKSAWEKKKKARASDSGDFVIHFRSARKSLRETLILEKGSNAGPLLRFLPLPYVQRKGHAQCLVKIGGDQFTKSGSCYFLLEDKPHVIERLVNEKIPLHDGKIIWDKRIGSFHFVYTYEIPRLQDPDPEFNNKRIVATDPGVYPFQAWYSPTSAEYGRLLDGESDKLLTRCVQIDKLQSRVDRFQGGRTRLRRQKYRTRKKLQRRLAKERNRLRGWVEAAHYNCANLLLRKHDLVIQPTLETARLSRRVSRRIQASTVRKMLSWSHYKFVQRLKSASDKYPGRHVITCKEPGTSKTCTNCGFWKADLKVSDKRFVCSRCSIVVDRQLAGARNNFLAAYGMAVGVGWDGVGE